VLADRPQLKHLLVHNIDTLGTNVDPSILGYHIEKGAGLTAEVINRRIEDHGGGLANIDGKIRLIEGLALPHEEIEFKLSYYNTGTTWIDVDQLLELFDVTRDDLAKPASVMERIRSISARMPTTNAYIYYHQGCEKALG
jgi:UDP-N-acetylglucosamine pyrophosphorylase